MADLVSDCVAQPVKRSGLASLYFDAQCHVWNWLLHVSNGRDIPLVGLQMVCKGLRDSVRRFYGTLRLWPRHDRIEQSPLDRDYRVLDFVCHYASRLEHVDLAPLIEVALPSEQPISPAQIIKSLHILRDSHDPGRVWTVGLWPRPHSLVMGPIPLPKFHSHATACILNL